MEWREMSIFWINLGNFKYGIRRVVISITGTKKPIWFVFQNDSKKAETDSTPVDTPEPQPETQPQPQPEQKPESYKQIDITSDIQQRVNIFLSNFSEQSFSEAEPLM